MGGDQIRKKNILTIYLIVLFLCFPLTVAADVGQVSDSEGLNSVSEYKVSTKETDNEQSTTKQTQTTLAPTIGTGIPDVTPEQFNNKIMKITSSIYDTARGVSPHLTILVIAVASVVGIFFKAARLTIIWALLGFALVFLSPSIVSLITHYLNM